MNSLVGNYGSDDDYDDSSEEKQMDLPQRNYRKAGGPKQDDANYDEVQMSLSEDSSDGSPPPRPPKEQPPRRWDSREQARRWDGREARGVSPKAKDDSRARKERAPSRDELDRRDSRDDKDRNNGRSDKEEERSKYKEEDRSRDRGDRYRDKDEDRGERYRDKEEDRGDRGRDREDERGDKHRSDKDDERYRDRRDNRRGKSKERYRDDRYRDRKDRDRRRSRSPRERRRSRSPRRSDRSRSKSKETVGRGSGYSKRYDRANNKMDRLDKMGIEIKTPDCQYVTPADLQRSMSDEKRDRFFVPGITGRFREQIEKRKLLWQKPETARAVAAPTAAVQQQQQQAAPGGSRTTKVWEATTFAQDTDGKVANKFKRLMGIKNTGDGTNSASEVLKKQEEMFSSMEQQYEVARTATHTMRGVGLGFGSYQR